MVTANKYLTDSNDNIWNSMNGKIENKQSSVTTSFKVGGWVLGGLSNYLLPCLPRFFKKSVNDVIMDNFFSQIVFMMIFVEILRQASFYSKQTKIQYPLKVYILKEVF